MNFPELLKEAYIEATKSPDPSNQNGAVTSWEGRVVERGYNHFYDGIEPNVLDRDKKLARIEHAERDALYRTGNLFGTLGVTLVCPWAACYDCARAIIGSQVCELVVHKQRQELTPERWRANVEESLGWIRAAGISIIEFDGPVPGAPSIIVNGNLWSPERLSFDS